MPSGCPSRRSGSCRTRVATSVTVAIVSSLVAGVTTISASFITGAGDAQCQPITRSGRSVAAASAAIGRPDVFDARIVVGGATRSRSRNTLIFRSSRSGTASITRSVAAASSKSTVNVMRASAASASARVELAAARPRRRARSDRSVTCSGPCVERVGRDVVADGLVAGDRGHLRDPAAHHARAEHSDAHRLRRRSSMRASQSPGASSSARVGTIVSPSQSRLRPSSPRALDDAAAERDARFVVPAFELEAEQPVDERRPPRRARAGAGAALRRCARARSPCVRRSSRRRRRCSPRARRRSAAAPRAAVPAGRMRIAPSSAPGSAKPPSDCIDAGLDEVEAAELRFERVGVASRTRRRTPMRAARAVRAPTAPSAARRARPRAARARSAARRRAATTPRRSRRRCAATKSSVGRDRRAAAAGRTDRARGARAARSSSRPTRRAAPAAGSA